MAKDLLESRTSLEAELGLEPSRDTQASSAVGRPLFPTPVSQSEKSRRETIWVLNQTCPDCSPVSPLGQESKSWEFPEFRKIARAGRMLAKEGNSSEEVQAHPHALPLPS